MLNFLISIPQTPETQCLHETRRLCYKLSSAYPTHLSLSFYFRLFQLKSKYSFRLIPFLWTFTLQNWFMWSFHNLRRLSTYIPFTYPGIKPMSPALGGGFFTTEPPRKPTYHYIYSVQIELISPALYLSWNMALTHPESHVSGCQYTGLAEKFTQVFP